MRKFPAYSIMVTYECPKTKELIDKKNLDRNDFYIDLDGSSIVLDTKCPSCEGWHEVLL